jgi:predicted metal-dependent phosphoesterase TrpH
MLKDYKGACHIHTHTQYSDGSILVCDVIKSAQDVGLDFVIVADYNTFFGEQ